jgi:hypothetical protein
LVLSCDLSFKDGKENDACGFALLGLLEPQRHPAAEARRQGLALAANAAAAQGTPRGVNATHSLGIGPDPWAELQIEALWSHRQRLDLPGVIKFLLASLASLERQGLRPNAVLIEDAANGPAVCQLLKRQVPGLIAIPPKGRPVAENARMAGRVSWPARVWCAGTFRPGSKTIYPSRYVSIHPSLRPTRASLVRLQPATPQIRSAINLRRKRETWSERSRLVVRRDESRIN